MNAVNLLPEDYLKRRAERRANITFLELFVIVMAGVLCAAFILALLHVGRSVWQGSGPITGS